jgi:outer membrane protein assembly factor BamD
MVKPLLAGFLARPSAHQSRPMAHQSSNREYLWLVLCALLVGPCSFTARAQAVQAQTGTSGGKIEAPPPKKKIKAHVVKEDTKKKKGAPEVGQRSVAPDKVLYERAVLDIKKGHYTGGRRSLQTLINTGPDSEYLAKAKLATADSYYKEGGISGLTQAVEEYKNFIIFFPFLDEAAYAQMQIGMAHFRMMEKPDRDTTQGLDAEQEFQTFLLKYPKSPLVPEAEQHLRDVQEVLADGQYRVARFYYLKQDYAASAARLMDLVERYPLYSQTDQALWMLADVYTRARKVSRNEDEKNHWADLAGECYDRIVKDYPLSSLGPQAKERLRGMGMPVPSPDPEAVAQMKKEQMYDKKHRPVETVSLLKLPLALFKSSPSVSDASHYGMPNLNPPDDVISAHDVLLQGAKGPDFNVANQAFRPTPAPPPANQDYGTPVDANTSSPGDVPQGSAIGVQIITPTVGSDAAPQPTEGGGTANPPAEQPAATSAPAVSNIAGAPITGAAPAAAAPAPSTSDPAGASAPAPPPAAVSGTSTGATEPDSAEKAKDDKKDKNYKTPKLDEQTESSSKKKKGLKKLIPW